MAQPTRESAIKRIVRTPQYRMRVERDKTKFVRKEKHKQSPDRKHDWAFLLLGLIVRNRFEIGF